MPTDMWIFWTREKRLNFEPTHELEQYGILQQFGKTYIHLASFCPWEKWGFCIFLKAVLVLFYAFYYELFFEVCLPNWESSFPTVLCHFWHFFLQDLHGGPQSWSTNKGTTSLSLMQHTATGRIRIAYSCPSEVVMIMGSYRFDKYIQLWTMIGVCHNPLKQPLKIGETLNHQGTCYLALFRLDFIM